MDCRLKEFDWVVIQQEHDNGLTMKDILRKYGFSMTTLTRARKKGLFTRKVTVKRKVSEDVRKKISEGRKKYLRENPDKHPWRDSNKFKSKPCEYLKNKLNEFGVKFIEEYQPSKDRFFSIDIAFPNKKIGVEINGNQHYNEVGGLKPYYQERNNYLRSIGWDLFEIHYSLIYNETFFYTLISNIINNSLSQEELDIFTEEQRKRKKTNKCLGCGCNIRKNSKNCVKCSGLKHRVVKDRPTKEQLFVLLENNNYSALGRMFNVSDNSVRKWVKKYNSSL